MVKLILSLVFILTCTCQAYARTIDDLEIKATGLNSRVEENPAEVDMCKDFSPTKKQIISYFNSARKLKEDETLLHEYYSPCVAEGNIKFNDGLKGEWTLQSSGLAYLLTDKNKTIVFF